MTMSDYIPGKRRRNGGPVTEDKIEPLPDFMANNELAEEYRRQNPMRGSLLPAVTTLPVPSPLSDPLHPLVTELINKSQLLPLETARSESAKNKAAMLAELQAEIAKDDQWWTDLLAEANHRAAVSAALHVKLRAFYGAMAQARADYDAPELPAVEEKKEETPKETEG